MKYQLPIDKYIRITVELKDCPADMRRPNQYDLPLDQEGEIEIHENDKVKADWEAFNTSERLQDIVRDLLEKFTYKI